MVRRNELMMAAIFLVNKEAKISAERFMSGGGGGGLNNVFKVENIFRVSLVQLILSL